LNFVSFLKFAFNHINDNSEIRKEHWEMCLEIAIFSNEGFTDEIEDGAITKL
jgi:hypothetical protein